MTDPVDPALESLLAQCAACRPWVEQDEGPYHVDTQLHRRDVTEGRPGASLQLGLRLTDTEARPVSAVVEIWQCDALGAYSGFPPPGTGGGEVSSPAPAYRPGETFLRGSQRTDAAGVVELRTIYPGWYPGRAVHIHVMVHTATSILVSQLYFPEEVTDGVHERPPYASRPTRDTTNEADAIFRSAAEPAVLTVAPAGAGLRAGACLCVSSHDLQRGMQTR